VSGALVAIGVGAFLIFMGFVGTLPWSVNPDFPRRRWADDTLGDEPLGYSLMLLGGVVVAGGVAGFVAAWLADSGDSPLGTYLVFLGAAALWFWVFDGLYRRLRRPPPNTRWARFISHLGNAGRRVGPPVLVVGVIAVLVS
jgi:hypothetical protein